MQIEQMVFPLTLSPFSPAHTSLLASLFVLAVTLLSKRITTMNVSTALMPCLLDVHELENEKESTEHLSTYHVGAATPTLLITKTFLGNV